MICQLECSQQKISFDLSRPLEISIPLAFNEPQPNSYSVPLASSAPYSVGDYIGDTRLGGSCNCMVLTVTPHCNGTHTESIGHISTDRVSITDILSGLLFPVKLVSVDLVRFDQSGDSYLAQIGPESLVISEQAIRTAVGTLTPDQTGLVIRTRPNDHSKVTKVWTDDNSPFFTNEAMQFVSSLSIEHLLIDTPSVDRPWDERMLSNHRIFWGVAQGRSDLTKAARLSRTITEMIYVPDNLTDGAYVASIQIPPFINDAAPSRVWLYKPI